MFQTNLIVENCKKLLLLRPENKVQFLGEFHHSTEGFLMGLQRKKGLCLFGENKKNMKKHKWHHLGNETRTKLNNKK